MTLMRATFLFYSGGYGWAESWFLNTSGPDYSGTRTKAINLVNKLTPILGNGTFINGIRISDESTFRDVDLQFFGTGNVGYQGAYVGSAPPSLALLASFQGVAAGAIPSIKPLRGIPLSMVASGNVFVPTVPWTAAFTSFYTQLGADAWGWKGATVRQSQMISALTQNANGTVHIVLSAPMAGVPLNTPITVSIARTHGAEQCRGQRQVVFTSTTLLDTIQGIPITPWIRGGTVLWSQKGFVQVDGTRGNWRRLAERKPGRPFYLSRGRLIRRAA